MPKEGRPSAPAVRLPAEASAADHGQHHASSASFPLKIALFPCTEVPAVAQGVDPARGPRRGSVAAGPGGAGLNAGLAGADQRRHGAAAHPRLPGQCLFIQTCV